VAFREIEISKSMNPAKAMRAFDPFLCAQTPARRLANGLIGVSPDWVMALVPVLS